MANVIIPFAVLSGDDDGAMFKFFVSSSELIVYSCPWFAGGCNKYVIK